MANFGWNGALSIELLAFFAVESLANEPLVKRIEPRDGFIRRAAIRNRVVFPAPLCPKSATNSPGSMSSEMARNAARVPNRFSTFWKEIPKPKGEESGGDAALFVFADNAASPSLGPGRVWFVPGARVRGGILLRR